MHKVASLNGEFVEAAAAKIGAVSTAAFYGRGVFTTVAIYAGEPFLWDKHLARLRRDMERVGLSKTDLSSIENSLVRLLRMNEVDNGRARITVFDRSSGPIWGNGDAAGSTVLIMTGDLRETDSEFRLTVSPFPINSRSPLAGIKSCNYLENLMAIEEAKSRGFGEAIRLNERGEVTSVCMANLFWGSDGQLFTPSLATGCLPGTTREFVIESLDCIETADGVDGLRQADSVYICSAGLGVRQIWALDERIFERLDHEILHLLPPKHTKTRMSAS